MKDIDTSRRVYRLLLSWIIWKGEKISWRHSWSGSVLRRNRKSPLERGDGWMVSFRGVLVKFRRVFPTVNRPAIKRSSVGIGTGGRSWVTLGEIRRFDCRFVRQLSGNYGTITRHRYFGRAILQIRNGLRSKGRRSRSAAMSQSSIM